MTLEELEHEINELKIETAKNQSREDTNRWWLSLLGLGVLAWFGFSNWYTIPVEVEARVKEAVGPDVLRRRDDLMSLIEASEQSAKRKASDIQQLEQNLAKNTKWRWMALPSQDEWITIAEIKCESVAKIYAATSENYHFQPWEFWIFSPECHDRLAHNYLPVLHQLDIDELHPHSNAVEWKIERSEGDIQIEELKIRKTKFDTPRELIIINPVVLRGEILVKGVWTEGIPRVNYED